MTRLERLTAIALFLGARRRVLAREVAEQFGVSLRTVYRDVKALAAAGFPVEGNAGDGYRVASSAFLRPLALTGDEAAALSLAAQAFALSVDGGMRDALVRATAKLEAALDPAAQRRVKELARNISVPDFARKRRGPTAEQIEALHERRVVAIAYVDTRDEKRTKRNIEPLGFACLGDAWWLIAYCRLRKGARAFRVDRIDAWRTLGETFEPRPGHSFGEVIARDGHLGPALFGS